jgi:hypothetical protein
MLYVCSTCESKGKNLDSFLFLYTQRYCVREMDGIYISLAWSTKE